MLNPQLPLVPIYDLFGVPQIDTSRKISRKLVCSLHREAQTLCATLALAPQV